MSARTVDLVSAKSEKAHCPLPILLGFQASLITLFQIAANEIDRVASEKQKSMKTSKNPKSRKLALGWRFTAVFCQLLDVKQNLSMKRTIPVGKRLACNYTTQQSRLYFKNIMQWSLRSKLVYSQIYGWFSYQGQLTPIGSPLRDLLCSWPPLTRANQYIVIIHNSWEDPRHPTHQPQMPSWKNPK